MEQPLRIMAYLLPMSGNILLQKLMDRTDVSIEFAFLPYSFIDDCSDIINSLSNADIPYTVPEYIDEDKHKSRLEKVETDIGVSVGYDQKLPPWLINHPTMGTMNIHPSLLPRYRGANPYFWTILNGEDTTGVSLHFMDEEFDTGPLIAQEELSMDPDETMGTLFFTLNKMGVNMVTNVLDDILRTGSKPPSREQPPVDDPPKAPKIRENNLKITWEDSYQSINRLVRAANPFFGAFTTFRGCTLRIYEVSKVQSEEVSETGDPGKIEPTPNGPVVKCKSNWARLEVVQFEQLFRSSGKMFQEREEQAINVLDRVI